MIRNIITIFKENISLTIDRYATKTFSPKPASWKVSIGQ